ncbi:restriction endonuclease subunit S [Streptococcus parasuis]|uniref:restriction endonuclease subunit S n=1 Tax=Streptococcus parasuis TaxID=1501662 RepID=UPI00370DDE10
MSEWKFLTLKEAELEFIDGDRGVNYPKKSELLPEGDCVFLNTGNVRQNSFDFSNLDFITKEKDNLLRNGKLQRDDIVLTTRGTVGNVALYSQEVPFSNIRINSGMVIIRVNKNFWHPYFIYLFFQSHLFKKQISRLISGSAQPQLPISILETVNIPQLTLDEQKEIIFNIKSIDQKIQINNQINQELEAMAKTLYDYWFVQFDFPDENGKPYKSSGGKMVYNDQLKLEIPEGWGVEKLENIANITMGQSPKGTSYNEVGEGMLFFQGSTDFGWRFPVARQYTTEPSRIAEEDDILLSVRAPVGTLNIADTRCCIGRGLAAINSKVGANSYIFNVMQDFKKLFDMMNSVGTTFGSITKDDLYSLKLIYPPNELLMKFDKSVNSFDREIKNRSRQNQELSQLRDWLLPMLMNGQVKVEDKT